MKFIPNSVSRVVGRQVLVAQKHSPTILFAGGVVGMVSTVVLASRATLKMDELLNSTKSDIEAADFILEQGRNDYTPKDHAQDLRVIRSRAALEIVKLYAPAVVVGTATLGCFVGSNRILNKRNLALTAAYSVVEKSFNDYRQRVREEFGEEKDEQLYRDLKEREVIVETETGPQPELMKSSNKDGHSMYAQLFARETNPNWSTDIWKNTTFLHHAQQYLNDRLRARGHVFLNEALDSLGFPHVPEGQIVGWLYESERGDGYVDFGIWEGNNYNKVRRAMEAGEGAIWLDFNVDGPIWRDI